MFYIAKTYESLFIDHGIRNANDLYDFFSDGEIVSESSTSHVWKKKMGQGMVYAKKYEYTSWRYFLRMGKGRQEMLSYRFFASLGILAPEVICVAEERSWGRVVWSLIVTKEVEKSVDLFKLLSQNRLDGKIRHRIMLRIAEILATLHNHRFLHSDFKFRNLLLPLEFSESTPPLYLIDCPRGRKKFYFSFRSALRDLLTLYKHGFFLCTPSEWDAFIQKYAQERRLDSQKLSQALLAKYEKKFSPPPLV